ncbi:glutathione S-transferase family protein [Novosphingobium rosa]|uniref:glutathione S-transferase family protein n=1 Tax=Novosphingobium rosa TaxID=76978 RepID=UPI000A75EC16|nr:glutathione S-transferase family protein [Novosphingobium rosa]
MGDFIVHGIPGSPFMRSVLATLIEKGASWQLASLGPGETRQDAHLARHPFGRVPVLEHDMFQLYETQAILRYLDRVLPEPALTPASPRAAARMDQLMNICDWYLFQGAVSVIGFHRIVGPMLLGLEPDEKAIATAMPKARKVFGVIADLLGSNPYMAGDELSLADLHLAPHFDFVAFTPEWAALSEGHPDLMAWMERMRARPGLQHTTMQALRAAPA